MIYERRFQSKKGELTVEVHLVVGQLRFEATLLVNGEEVDYRSGFMRLRALMGWRRHRIMLRGESVRADLRFNKKIAHCYWLRRRSQWESFVYGLGVFQEPPRPRDTVEESPEAGAPAS